MPFASATSGDESDLGESPTDPGCLMTDVFNRVTVPFDGGYTTGNNWGVSENTGLQWHGSSTATFVDGSSGVLQIWGPPHPADRGWTNIFAQEAFLNWSGDRTPMDITLLGRFSRALAGDDTGHPGDPDYWGEYLWIFFGDGPPFGNGKFVFEIKGNTGAQLVLWDEAPETGDAPLGSLNSTNPFYIRAQCAGAGSPVTVSMWDASSDPSSGITLSLPQARFSNHGITIELATMNNEVAGLLEFHLEEIDVKGLNSCTP